MRFFEIKQKEVINIKDGCRLGYVCDLIIDKKEGEILKIIVPGPAKLFGMFGREQEYRVDWDDVKQIGDDIILIDCDVKGILVDCDEE